MSLPDEKMPLAGKKIPPAKRKKPLLKIIALLLVFMGSFLIGKFIADWGILGGLGRNSFVPEGAELPVDRLNVLLLGIDARPGEKEARTDSIILASIDRDTKKIALVSIPRDTLVEIPGHGQNKINLANPLGGAELACRTVEDLLGVQIPYYVKTNFNGFKEIVDTLGGVNIEVEKRMYNPAEEIDLKPGQQKLDGYDALGYVRYRHDALGDITRTERQQKFLTALAREMLQARTIIKLPKLIPQLMTAVDTNLKVGDAIFLARVASNLDSNNIVTATLPGVFYNYKGGSYWKVDEAKAKVILNDLFAGLKVATVTGPDINVPADGKATRKPKPNSGHPPEEGQSSSGDKAGDTGEESSGRGNDVSNSGQESSGQPEQDSDKPGLPPDSTKQPGQDQGEGSSPTGGNSGPGPVNPAGPGNPDKTS